MKINNNLKKQDSNAEATTSTTAEVIPHKLQSIKGD